MTTESETYIGVKPCGCLIMAIVDRPEHQKDVAKEVAKAIREGLKVSRVPTQQVRDMPWECPLHKAEKGEPEQTIIEVTPHGNV